MGRLGVDHARAAALVPSIARLPAMKIQGLYTHYSSVEDDADFTREQSRRFQAVVAQLGASGIEIPWIHANNSGALLHEPDTLYNLVRPGLMVYGLAPEGLRPSGSDLRLHLRPALSWKCRVSFVKAVPTGTPLSYGHTVYASAAMRIATLTAGYGDGYLRACSNKAQVLIRGVRCPIVGRITMDPMLADVTQAPEASAGDEAALIGSQGHESITANELAAWMGTIPWEVFTSITYRVPRLYRGGEAS
jgi:alanine racemase